MIAAIAALLSLSLALLGALPSRPARGEAPHSRGSGFAVLELFTSQGCSSCPPADALLSALQRDYADAPVFALSFHVDYWNDLGWRDPFSDAAYSARQRRYARALGSRRVYTPQLVINGESQLVGSRSAAVRASIEAALRGGSPARLDLSVRFDGRHLHTRHRARHAPAGSGVTLALVRRTAASEVTRGENRGRTLRHVQVVQELRAEELSGSADWALPRGLSADQVEVVGMVQQRETLAIAAAARAR